MALYFQRDTTLRVYPNKADGTRNNAADDAFVIPVLEGFSFSQTTNSSEVTISEMESTGGTSRRGRKSFNDSLAPVEWSFSTYLRPFLSSTATTAGLYLSTTAEQHVVDEVLWNALLAKGRLGEATGEVDRITVTMNSGVYSAAPTVTIASSGSGTGATATAVLFGSAHANAGKLSHINVTASGSSYATGTTTVTLSAPASGTAATAVAVIGAGEDSLKSRGVADAALVMDSSRSNKAALNTFFLEFDVGGSTVYQLNKAVVNSATINFEVDGIATVEWSGSAATITSPAPTAFTTLSSTARAVTEGGTSADTGNFIRNRLTSLSVDPVDGGLSDITAFQTGGALNAYGVTLTGGSITIENGIEYLVPEELGVINKPIEHVTGVRNISGSFTCYLASGTNGSKEFFEDMTSTGALDVVAHDFALVFKVGGASGTPRVEFSMPHCHIEVPSHSIEDLLSLETNFSALQSDMESNSPDDMTISFYGA